MKKLIFVGAFILLTGCGRRDLKPAETFPHEFVETIEVENIEIEEIDVRPIEVKPIEVRTIS